jgi:hypothetical protein
LTDVQAQPETPAAVTEAIEAIGDALQQPEAEPKPEEPA